MRFLGFRGRDELAELYACADVFCLPSLHEPWGVVVNEAAACGLPLVVSDRVGAGRDLVAAGENGMIVGAGDVEGLSRALRDLLCAPAALGAMGRASRSLARDWGYDRALGEFRAAVDCAMQGKERRR